MSLDEIRNFPTTIDTGINSKRVHESVLRSFQVVQKIKELLDKNTPAPVLLEIIDDLMGAKQKDWCLGT